MCSNKIFLPETLNSSHCYALDITARFDASVLVRLRLFERPVRSGIGVNGRGTGRCGSSHRVRTVGNQGVAIIRCHVPRSCCCCRRCSSSILFYFATESPAQRCLKNQKENDVKTSSCGGRLSYVKAHSNVGFGVKHAVSIRRSTVNIVLIGST